MGIRSGDSGEASLPGDSERSKSGSTSISASKDSPPLIVSTTMISENNFTASASTKSSENSTIASTKEIQNQSSASEEVFEEIPIKRTSTSELSRELSSKVSEAAAAPITSFPSESLSFDLRNIFSIESNDLTFESSGILSILSSTVAYNSDDNISLTTLAASSESLSMSVDETKATATNIPTTTTNGIAEKPSSSSLSPSSNAARHRLPRRESTRRARINKTPSGIITEANASDIDGEFGKKRPTPSENFFSDSAAESLDISAEHSTGHERRPESVSSAESIAREITSSLEFASSFISHSSPMAASAPEVNVGKTKAQTTMEIPAPKTVVRSHQSVEAVFLQPDDSFLKEASESSEKLRFLKAFEDVTSSISSEKISQESLLESEALEVSTPSQLETSAPIETKNLNESISFSPLGELPEMPETGSTKTESIESTESSDDKESSSSAETVIPSIQTFQTRRSFTTSGQDTSGNLGETTRHSQENGSEDDVGSEGKDEDEEDSEGEVSSIRNEDDEAGEDDDEELDDYETVGKHLPEPKHPKVPKAFNINEFESPSLRKDTFAPEKFNKEKTPLLRLTVG